MKTKEKWNLENIKNFSDFFNKGNKLPDNAPFINTSECLKAEDVQGFNQDLSKWNTSNLKIK